MTDTRPICPIPPDAKVGDVVVLRNGTRQEIDMDDLNGRYGDNIGVSLNFSEDGPFGLEWDGTPWHTHCKAHECIAFEYADGRKPNLPHTARPKRTQVQRDAAITASEDARMLAIADRLGEQQ